MLGNTSSKIRVERYKQKAPKKQGFLFPPAKQDVQSREGQGEEGGPGTYHCEETGGQKHSESFGWKNAQELSTEQDIL